MKPETSEQKLQRLEGDIAKMLTSQWCGRPEVLDDILQMGRLALYDEIQESPEASDEKLKQQAKARADGDIKNWLKSKGMTDLDLKVVQEKIDRIHSRPLKQRKPETVPVHSRLTADVAAKLEYLAMKTKLSKCQIIAIAVEKELAHCQIVKP